METTTRNATLAELAQMLTEQSTRKLDVVAPATKVRSVNGNIVIAGAEAQIGPDGVTNVDGTYRPTAVFDEGIAAKLGVPLAYVRRMRSERPDLYDANVNGWLHGQVDPDGDFAKAAPDTRRFLVRCFTNDEGPGIARAFLSDSYRVIDNLDVLTAALSGVREADTNVVVSGCDLTDRKMYVRIEAPEVKAYSMPLLERYRSPFSGQSGADLPVIHAGLVISNSETGGGAFTIVPRMVIEVCNNGMTMNKDAVREVHLGGKLDEGVVQWSTSTQEKQLELVTSKTRDAVATFLNVDYMTRAIARLEQQAQVVLTDGAEVVKRVGQKLFTQEQTAGILDHFIKGGDLTAGGVMHAVTSFAQTVDDADTAYEIEASGVKALELAAGR